MSQVKHWITASEISVILFGLELAKEAQAAQPGAFTAAELDCLIRRLKTSVPSGESPRVVIILEGGLVRDVISEIPIIAKVLDYDIEGSDEDELTKLRA